MIGYGNKDVPFAHSWCFVRRDHIYKKEGVVKVVPQLVLLDCKNDNYPVFYPKKLPSQGHLEGRGINIVKDLLGESYYKWELYGISSR